MSEAIEQATNEPEANPYNQKKEWHTPDKPSRGSADGLFFEEPKAVEATPDDEAPQEEAKETKKRTNYKKRYDDLKKHYDEKIAEFKQRELEMAAMAAENTTYAPPKSIEDLEEFKTQYPDLYETVETVAHLQSEQQVEALKAKMSVIEQREASIRKREAEETLRTKHPDFESIKTDESFHAWAENQPEQIQDWIYNNPDNATLAVKAIDLYKLENGISTETKAKTKQSQPESSAADFVSTKTTTVDAKQPKVWTQREIAALSMAQYDKYEEEIDQAIMEGRVVP
jgi:hypothetical protein